MPTTIRLKDYTPKPTPTLADIIYGGNAADSFNEVKFTIQELFNVYPGIVSIGTLTTSADKMIYSTASNVYATTTLTSYARSLLDDVDAATARGTLGLGTMATQSATAYLLLAGGTMAGALDMGSHLINNVTNPSSAQDAATKAYVDAAVAGGVTVFTVKWGSVGAYTVTYANGTAGVGATLTNAGVQAAFAPDGSTASVNDRVLVKNQASTLQNGIYTVTTVGSGATNWVLTRATDYDAPSEISPGDLMVITSGSTLANTTWIQTATVTAVGTDPITFSQFSLALPVSLASGGTGTALTASNGGIVYSGASALAILAGTATAGLLLQSGSSGAPSWLATANSAVLTTSVGGVPVFSTTLPNGLAMGTPASLTLTNALGLPYAGIAANAWSSFVPTVTGFASTTVNIGRYVTIGKLIIVQFSITGASNGVGFTITNMPVASANVTNSFPTELMFGQDNSVGVIVVGQMIANSSTLSLYNGVVIGAWTAAGTKQLYGTFIYETG